MANPSLHQVDTLNHQRWRIIYLDSPETHDSYNMSLSLSYLVTVYQHCIQNSYEVMETIWWVSKTLLKQSSTIKAKVLQKYICL